jgi:hypothetical protein
MSGVDPRTGAVFPSDSPYHDKDVSGALSEAAACFKTKYRLIESASANAGKPWSNAEDEKLLKAVNRGLSAPEIAGELGRTRPGIEARLEHLQSRRQFRSNGYKSGTMDEGCANCGQGFGQHYNGTCPAVSAS